MATSGVVRKAIDRLERRIGIAELIEPRTPMRNMPSMHKHRLLVIGKEYLVQTGASGVSTMAVNKSPMIRYRYLGKCGHLHVFRSATGWTETFTDYQLATTEVGETE